MLSDGNSRTRHPSSEPENSSGKKDTQLMLPENKPKKRPSSILISTEEFMKNYLLFQFAKVSKQRVRNSLEEISLPLLRHGSQRTEELFKLPPVIILDRTLLRCSELNSLMKRKKSNMLGKQVGD